MVFRGTGREYNLHYRRDCSGEFSRRTVKRTEFMVECDYAGKCNLSVHILESEPVFYLLRTCPKSYARANLQH